MTYRSFKEARKFVRSLKLKTYQDWTDFYKSGKLPSDIPRNPYTSYKKEYKGTGDWLGTGRIANQDMEYRSFKEARKFVRSLKLKTGEDWTDFYKSGKLPSDIPRNPYAVYKKEYKGLGDWLGTGRIANQDMEYRSFEEAKIEIRKLGKQHKLKNQADWVRFARTHKKLLSDLHLPIELWRIYSKERVWSRMKK